jgi:hypothetical protein
LLFHAGNKLSFRKIAIFQQTYSGLRVAYRGIDDLIQIGKPYALSIVSGFTGWYVDYADVAISLTGEFQGFVG